MLMDLGAAMLRRLPPEAAHRATLRLLALAGPLLPQAPADDPALAITAFGLRFPNPLGLAAGFDKNGEVPGAMARLGFGFVECGTVTPRPQAGNPKPRLFRLGEDAAVINRMGFNNAGMDGDGSAHDAAPARRHHRHQYRRQQGQRRPHRRLPHGVREAGAACRLCDGQHLLAQHAGPARPAEPRRAATPARHAERGARGARLEGAAAAQDRAGHRRGGDGRHRAGVPGGRASKG